MSGIFYKSEAYKVIGACMEVHKALGFGFLEIIYKDALELEFIERGINFLREDEYAVSYKGQVLKHKFFADFTVSNNIILEIKANNEGISADAVAQTLNYLKVSGYRLALLVNFGKTSLQYKRLVF